MGKIIQFAKASTGGIDTETRTLYGVSLITEGPVRGHDVWADSQTLETVKKSAETYSGGLKVKLNHSDSVSDIVGYIDNFSISDSHLRGDMHLLENSDASEYVIELASTIPESIGLSVAFSYDLEKVDGLALLAVRCVEIFSCDLVDSPAANPNGLFSMDQKEPTADTKADTKTDKSATPPPVDDPRVTALETTIASLSATVQSFQTVIDGIVKAQEVQAAEFASKLEAQKVELTAQLKDADILAARKVSATGVSADKSKSLASTAGVVLNHIDTLEALADPQERMAYFQKHRALIAKEYARRK